jgi:hypothetical protein
MARKRKYSKSVHDSPLIFNGDQKSPYNEYATLIREIYIKHLTYYFSQAPDCQNPRVPFSLPFPNNISHKDTIMMQLLQQLAK